MPSRSSSKGILKVFKGGGGGKPSRVPEDSLEKEGDPPGLKGRQASPARVTEGDKIAVLTMIFVALVNQIPEEVDIDEFGTLSVHVSPD